MNKTNTRFPSLQPGRGSIFVSSARRVAIAAFLAGTIPAAAQITAESQGGALTLWTAVGFDKELGKSKWTSITDIGFGRHSDPNDLSLADRQGLVVITQDFSYRFNKHWQATISAGYWHRNYYEADEPFDPQHPNTYRNEFRPFQRVYYDWGMGKIKFSNQVRTDYRFYFTPNWQRWPSRFEFRARDMIKAQIPVGKSGKNSVILMYEILAGKDKYGPERQAKYGSIWSSMTWFDNRPCLFVRHHLDSIKADWDVGIMYQRDRTPYDERWDTSVNLMMDVIFRR